jgi:acyl transferase domain-containing protein
VNSTEPNTRYTQSTPEIVYLIPGQGGDPRGALRGLYRAENWIRSAIDEVCAQVDPVAAGHDLPPVGDVLLAGQRTPMAYGVAPLAAYTASIALHRILADAGVRPTCVIGQSFGEIATLVCAGAFTVAEGATAVCALRPSGSHSVTVEWSCYGHRSRAPRKS